MEFQATRLDFGENVRMALSAVRANKFRSSLTILGIVIGITTVVTVSSLLSGLRKGVVVFFEEFGPDNIFVQQFGGDPGRPAPGGKEGRRRPMRPEYAELIKKLSPAVKDVAVSMFVPGFVGGRPITARVSGFESDNMSVAGFSANIYDLQPRELAVGRVFTAEEAARGARVCAIGASLAEALFPDGRAVGRDIIVAGAEYRVLGVFAAAKGGFFGENGLDRQIAMPLRTVQLRYPQVDRYLLTAQALPGKRSEALEEVTAAMRKIRRLKTGVDDDFNVSTPDQIIQQFDRLTGLIGVISIAISALGLLVGGIGVMNIMLVSVTERTREIGVRKAIGARRFDIVLQFLTEAVTLTGLGGVAGILFAVMVTLLVGTLVPSLPTEVPPWAVAAGFLMSVMTGVFFGVWPAFKASRLDPVEALRYE